MRGMAVDIKVNDFNPRPPRGGRQNNKQVGPHFQVFQSTPSARRATHALDKMASNYLISIHALREEGDRTMAWTRTGWGNFNPRPPRGGRPRPAAVWKAWRAFQSTPSARRATQLPPLVVGVAGYFNPRPPRGGRPTPFLLHSNQIQFQSTPSARRATEVVPQQSCRYEISIHALREEGDQIFVIQSTL